MLKTPELTDVFFYQRCDRCWGLAPCTWPARPPHNLTSPVPVALSIRPPSVLLCSRCNPDSYCVDSGRPIKCGILEVIIRSVCICSVCLCAAYIPHSTTPTLRPTSLQEEVGVDVVECGLMQCLALSWRASGHCFGFQQRSFPAFRTRQPSTG